MFSSILLFHRSNTNTPTAATVVIPVTTICNNDKTMSLSSSSYFDPSCTTIPSSTYDAILLSIQQRFPIIQNIIHVFNQFNTIYTILLQWLQSIHIFYILSLILISFYLLPTIEIIYQSIYFQQSQLQQCDETTSTSTEATRKQQQRTKSKVKPFQDTFLYILCDNISQISRIAIVVYIIDFLTNVVVNVCFTTNVDDSTDANAENNISNIISKILYIVWTVQRISVLKYNVIKYSINIVYSNVHVNVNNKNININSANTHIITPQSKRSYQLGTVMIINKIVDTLLIVGTIMILFNIIDDEFTKYTTGSSSTIFTSNDSRNMNVKNSTLNNNYTNTNTIQNSIRTYFAIGSTITLLVGILIKDFGTMIVNGITIGTTNRFAVGDDIKFGDGTTGVIQHIGWIQTTIVHYDNSIEIIPNTILGNQRVKNISRTNQCRIQQNLRFYYKDTLVLPKVLDSIIDEIKLVCPELISDGSRPLRAVISEFCDTHIKVIVTLHFNIRPIGKKFCYNRQQCLLAIYRVVVQQYNLQFITSYNLLENTNTNTNTTGKSSTNGISPNLDSGSCR